ncbi:MAG TPA: FixH family protein [Kofleriaceae bacterium]|nr:FixH family protein [Kofleriaceae bacterium]
MARLLLACSAAIVIATSALAGCADETASPDLNSGPLVQIDQSTSTSGGYQVVVFAHTSKLTRGDYSLQYVFTNTSDGSPVDGLTMTIVPWMPAMGHGTPIIPMITPLGGGAYQLDDVDLFMPGLWQLRTTTTAMQADQVEPALQVE